MSTSDPRTPGATDGPDEPTTTPDETTAIETSTPASDDSPAHEVAPTVETLDPPAASEPATTPAAPDRTGDRTAEPEPATPPLAAERAADRSTAPEPATAPSTDTAPATDTDGPGLDTGRHAVVRPAPTPPEDPAPEPVVPTATPTTPPSATTPGRTAPAAAAEAPATPATPAQEPAATSTTPAASDDSRLFPDPNAPRTTSAGSHVLGVLVGLLLGPIGIALLLVGQSRILEAQVDGWDASTDVLGIVLVTAGLLLLGCVLLLALWTPAVPLTAGTLLTLAGIVYLYVPSVAREQSLVILSSSGWRGTVTQVTVAGTSGTVLVAGFLLLLAGIVAAVARRRGVHLGAFRERHRV